ncbi:MAG: hypothetical protein HOD60_06925 [Candidatus Nitrosopelagicus sp.]|jgi:hypothetical protein|nr:hypothetical protein [Candidatus Nitrosopelagicus sp.]
MNGISKVLFWIFTIALGFVNPLISVALVILYYLPGIIQSACNPCNDASEINELLSQSVDGYSDDVLEEMK